MPAPTGKQPAKPPGSTRKRAAQATAASRAGQPSKLTDSTHATIIGYLSRGDYIEAAAPAAGVHKDTVYEWLHVAADARRKIAAADKAGQPYPDLTDHEQRSIRFSDAVDQAQAQAELSDSLRLAQHAEGGLSTSRVVEKRDGRGRLVERTTTTETVLSNPAVLMWRMERRHPDRWGRRRIELSGPDGEAIPVEARIGGLAGKIRELRGLADMPPEDDDERLEG